jgi:beta-lactamase class A
MRYNEGETWWKTNMPSEPPHIDTNTSWLPQVGDFSRSHRKKVLLIIVGTIVLVCVLSVLVQLAYPSDRALPGTKLLGSFVSFQDSDRIRQALQKLDWQPLTLQLAGKTYKVTPHDAGLTFASSSNVTAVLRYPVAERFIPFSIFSQHKQAVQNHLLIHVNDPSRLQRLAAQLASESNAQPIEGVITVQNGQVVENPPKPGVQFTAEEIADKLQSLPANLPSRIIVTGQAVPPTYDAAAVQIAARQATDLIQPFTITIDTATFVAPAATVGSWLTFTPNQATKSIDIGFDGAAIKSYLIDVAKQIYQVPTRTTVTLLDNREASRKNGSVGHYLDTAAGATSIAAALSQKSSSATLTSNTIASPISYVYTYSATSAGLQALLDNWVKANPGVKWGISIAELGGKDRSASYDAGASFMPASIYKLYVSYTAQTEIAAGTLDPGASTATGQSVATCLDIMIINSDNPCAHAIADMVGWDTVTANAHAAGFTSTNLSADSLSSTPGDTTLFLEKLANGSLMDGTQTAALLSRMEQQIYREGLPAGSSGATVADKVGFYGDYLHDAGIVYYPGNTYVVSVFSYGGSWGQIADLGNTISSYMQTH